MRESESVERKYRNVLPCQCIRHQSDFMQTQFSSNFARIHSAISSFFYLSFIVRALVKWTREFLHSDCIDFSICAQFASLSCNFEIQIAFAYLPTPNNSNNQHQMTAARTKDEWTKIKLRQQK